MVDRRTLLRTGLALGVAGIVPAWASTSAAEIDESVLRTIDPELRPIAKLFAGMTAGMPPLSAATLAQQRKAGMAWAGKLLTDVPYDKQMVPVGRGQPDVAVYVINAKAEGRRPAILHTHGGGYVMLAAFNSLRANQELARALDCCIVSVDYRLAPETSYAGSIEDNYAGLKWLYANAGKLGVDPARLAVMGESAGGGHAAILAIVARDRGEVPLVFQSLTYPMLDDRTGTSRPVSPNVGRVLWSADNNRFGWDSFLGTRAGGAKVPRIAVPARAESLAGLPPGWIGVGSIDLFRDEDIDYARRLNDAGVRTGLVVVPGAFHGFDSSPTRIARTFQAARLEALRQGLGVA